MNCEKARAAILRGAESGGRESVSSEVSDHLSSCADCRAAMEDHRLVMRVLTTRRDAPVPLGFATRVVASLESGQGWLDALNWRLWTYRLAPVAAALLLVSILTLAPATSRTPAEFAQLVDAWAADDNADAVPMFSVFWQQDVTEDDLLEAVLTADPDEPRWE